MRSVIVNLEVRIIMKFLKILSVILVIAMLSSFFISCEGVTVKYEIEGCFEKKEDVKNNDDQGVTPDDEEQARYKVKAHVKVVDYNNKELYSTDELFEYDSAFFEPTIVQFLKNHAEMNDKKISCKIASNGLISSISITKKGNTTSYNAEETIISHYDGSEQKTYWICYVNGRAVDSMKETLVKDGDVIAFYYVYPNWDKESITTPETTVPETPAETIPEDVVE